MLPIQELNVFSESYFTLHNSLKPCQYVSAIVWILLLVVSISWRWPEQTPISWDNLHIDCSRQHWTSSQCKDGLSRCGHLCLQQHIYIEMTSWFPVSQHSTETNMVIILMGLFKKDITPLLTHWSYVFLALTHRYYLMMSVICLIHCFICPLLCLPLRCWTWWSPYRKAASH